ncbi:MAG TPA: hypothetical protein G4O11_01065 [Anaerolineae bacterium]|nr:hypothetical protein [Anaerolineae bacterium]
MSKPKPSKREITIGVTGHRWIRETLELTSAIDQVIETILQTYSGRTFTVLSPLAEGADRVIAKRLLRHQGTKLTAILPMPLEKYLGDFSSDESKKEFHRLLDQADKIIELSHPTSRDEAYAAAGKYILDHCDLLFAIWDGQVAQGKGGTGDIIRLARERDLPLVWIRYTQRDQNTKEAVQQEERTDRIFFERFPSQNPLSIAGEE